MSHQLVTYSDTKYTGNVKRSLYDSLKDIYKNLNYLDIQTLSVKKIDNYHYEMIFNIIH